ncbi:endonuclease/exonuclease/phosphatase family protein [Microbispora sp. RL4-1S]|uniref:Endonuclease/exonuclease/phosphatase family protein n=1 Tax=Microbispora oryzae TaxID=2806554 RepID=A0A940WFW9_9ACTN|nr:endonuclease/exonuclease/phosphatase family protein [Microbispora oryzae]MBP2702457.1 endonuclease/exonuclease/phosphatase family protein [Microbispora oryzae]
MLRVASYNVRGLRDDRAALIRVVAAARPDVLCVQEAPRFASWRARRRRLAHRAGMTVAAGGRAGGVAVFAGPAVRVLHGSGHPLRRYAGLEWRAAAVAVVEKEGARYAVCCAHLDLVAGARLRHATEVVAVLDGTARVFGAAPVLAADVNEEPDGPAWRYLARRWADCFAVAPRGDGRTFPAARPSMRIDGVFAGPGLEVLSCGGVAGVPAADLAAASDHLPVIADLRPR